MYVKLFSKILDSSIWFQPIPTRLVWLTLLLMMDDDGIVAVSSPTAIAQRARVTLEEAEEAIKYLSAPDPDSRNPDNEGKRIQRVPGGYEVLNGLEYRKTKDRDMEREKNRLRVKKFRDKERGITEVKQDITVTDNSLHNITGALQNITSASAYTSSYKKKGGLGGKGNGPIHTPHPDEVKMVLDEGRKQSLTISQDKKQEFWDMKFSKYLQIDAKTARAVIGVDEWNKILKV